MWFRPEQPVAIPQQDDDGFDVMLRMLEEDGRKMDEEEAAKKKAEREKARQERAAWDKRDSIDVARSLRKAVAYAERKSEVKYFFREKEYAYGRDDSIIDLRHIRLRLEYGHLFDEEDKHLIVTRERGGWANWWIYHLEEGKLMPDFVFQKEENPGGYIRDTIMDVDGDGWSDYLVHWYPTAGCCRRHVYFVYLYQQEDGTFTNRYEFINPTFSPKEGIIRGVCYGHPGRTDLYKYKWNHHAVDTVEYILSIHDDKGRRRLFQSKTSEYAIKSGMKRLTAAPAEYHSIDSYGWFVGYD